MFSKCVFEPGSDVLLAVFCGRLRSQFSNLTDSVLGESARLVVVVGGQFLPDAVRLFKIVDGVVRLRQQEQIPRERLLLELHLVQYLDRGPIQVFGRLFSLFESLRPLNAECGGQPRVDRGVDCGDVLLDERECVLERLSV